MLSIFLNLRFKMRTREPQQCFCPADSAFSLLRMVSYVSKMGTSNASCTMRTMGVAFLYRNICLLRRPSMGPQT